MSDRERAAATEFDSLDDVTYVSARTAHYTLVKAVAQVSANETAEVVSDDAIDEDKVAVDRSRPSGMRRDKRHSTPSQVPMIETLRSQRPSKTWNAHNIFFLPDGHTGNLWRHSEGASDVRELWKKQAWEKGKHANY